MKAVLLDVNVLLAVFWPAHEHHETAIEWLRSRKRGQWATCPLTELAFVRILSNPSFSRDALSPGSAVELLTKNLAHPQHEFWPDELDVGSALLNVFPRLRGHRQIMDAYLVQLAAHRGAVLATFDHGVSAMTPEAASTVLVLSPNPH